MEQRQRCPRPRRELGLVRPLRTHARGPLRSAVGLVLAAAATLKVPWSQGPIWGALTLFWSGVSPCKLERLPSSYSNAGFNNANVGRLGYAMSGYAEAGQAAACQ